MEEVEEKDIELYKKALKLWGYEFQLIMFAEEFSELFKELSKTLRGKGNGVKAISEEFADVYIMLEQMEIAFNINKKSIRNMRAMKLGRLEETIEKSESLKRREQT